MVTQYPYEIIEKKVENTGIKLIGVEHTYECWNQWKNFYTEKIEQSPEGIVLEQVAGGEFWQDGFFSQLGKIAYKNNITVYNADPANNLNYTLELDLHLPGLIGAGLMGYGLGSKKITRRNFLRSVLFPPLGFSIMCGYAPFHEALKKIRTSLPQFDSLVYGQIDWRNVLIAEGIEKIVEKDKPKKLTAFHGTGHTKPISFYLDNPNLREIKKELYLPLNEIGIKGVRKYTPKEVKYNLNALSQVWELTEKW